MNSARPCRRRQLALWLLAGGTALLFASGQDGAPRRLAITLLSTTDLHGNIYPVDYWTGSPANRGLAKIATLVRRERERHPNTLLVDCGDTTQGTPLAFYAARLAPAKPNPIIAAMNELGYDAMAIGNHDFNFGLAFLTRVKTEARFPWLAANLRQQSTPGPSYIAPYVIKTVAGVRVGIIGFVTPAVRRWELPENYRGYEFEPIVEAARRMIPALRAKADLVVVLAHSGLERDPETDSPVAHPGENAMRELAETVPGIDVILFGHTHRELAGKMINGVIFAQAKYWGQSLAAVDVDLESNAESGWRVAAKSSRTIPVTDDVPADPDTLALARPYHEATEAYLNQRIGRSAAELDGRTGRIESHTLVDLIHRAQIEAGHADVSLATLFSTAVRFRAGDITVRQTFALYPYENILYTVEMTGAQLKETLEASAAYYPAWPCSECGPGKPIRLPGYEADSASGVRYTIDVTQPPGQRIRGLEFRGKAVSPAQKFHVALNHYRYYGGGGILTTRPPILRRSTAGIRDLVITYVKRHHELSGQAPQNWHIEPTEALAALRREALGQSQAARWGPPRRVYVAPPGTRHATAFTPQTGDNCIDTRKPSCYFRRDFTPARTTRSAPDTTAAPQTSWPSSRRKSS